MAAKLLIAAAGVLGTTYLSSPYVALYRLGRDLHAGDCAALASDVDWNQVRAGFHAQMAEAAAAAAHARGRRRLPAFGASFVTHVVNHVIDRVVTPEGLVAVVDARRRGAPGRLPAGRLGQDPHGARLGVFQRTAQLRRLAAYRASGARSRCGCGLRARPWRVVRVMLPKRAHRTSRDCRSGPDGDRAVLPDGGATVRPAALFVASVGRHPRTIARAQRARLVGSGTAAAEPLAPPGQTGYRSRKDLGWRIRGRTCRSAAR